MLTEAEAALLKKLDAGKLPLWAVVFGSHVEALIGKGLIDHYGAITEAGRKALEGV